jgi:hypothetical protein
MSSQIQSLVAFRLPITQRGALGLLALFVCVQIADAFLTAAGISRFGLAAEGNPMLALHIGLFGPAVALSVAKGVAVVGAVVLYQLSRHTLLASLTVMYVFGAIVPWAWALSIA